VSFVLCVDNAAEFMAAVEQFAEDVQRGCLDVVQDACLDGAEHARSVGAFKDVTGELRRSIKAFPARRTGNGAEGSFGTTLKRAVFVEDDTKAHTIRPKAGEGTYGPLRQGQSRRAKGDIGTHRIALRWTEGGAVRFARVVHHPGTKGKPFIGPGAIKAEGVLYAKAELLSARAIARFQRA
jgi:hypothetical protein